MKTFEDLQTITEETERQAFVLAAIREHKAGELYQDAVTAYDYFRKRNVTIREYQKLLYTITGEAVPDNYSANYKLTNAFFPIFVKQENSHLLGNGVTFGEDGTKEKLGDDFDMILMKAGEYALWGGVSFGFFNLDHVDVFKVTEFVPLIGEEDGGLHAGIRFWQIDPMKPLRATLYEQDGYTEYMWQEGECTILHPKSTYKKTVRVSAADGSEIIDGKNYPGFPIVPLWGNQSHQSELTGLREKIDAYDLIQSGLCNTIDDTSLVYWTITNAGGMDDLDLAKFVERMKTVHAATVDDSGSSAEAHTTTVPYEAHESSLQILRDALYRDAMALDTEKITAGSVTATAIQSSYENLNLKCDEYEMCVIEFIKGLLELIGVKDEPTFKRSKIINMAEDTQMVLSAAEFLDDETILKHLPFLSPDEIDTILANRTREEAERYEAGDDEEAMIDANSDITEGILDEYGNDVIAMLEELEGGL